MTVKTQRSVIAVFCDTQGCGTVWFDTSSIVIGPMATVYLEETKDGPCPQCGGLGRVPDGIYTNASAHLFNQSDLDRVRSALDALRRYAAHGASTEEIKHEINNNYSFLRKLAAFLPKNPKDLVLYLGLLLMVVDRYISSKHTESTQHVHVDVHISKTLEEVSSDLKTIPPKTPAPPKGKSANKHPKR